MGCVGLQWARVGFYGLYRVLLGSRHRWSVTVPLRRTRCASVCVVFLFRLWCFFFGGGEFLETAIEQTEVVDVVVWPQVSYEESVPKDLEVNRTVMRITAADVDFGENARIAYALQAGQPQDRDYFDVDRTTGIIQLKKPLTVRSLHSFIHPCLPRFSLST